MLSPDAMFTGLGGTGVAAVFDNGNPGLAVLFRSELDGLPIHETGNCAWRSRIDGRGHLCGHDGHDRFAACHNHPEAEALVRSVFAVQDIATETISDPFRWSEDFGLFGSVAKSALFVLGAGIHHPRLHNPDYDFPDALIPLGVRLFEHITRAICD